MGVAKKQCPRGYKFGQKFCYKADYKCPRGWDNRHGRCQKETRAFATKQCPHAFKFQSGACYKIADYQCPRDYEYDVHDDKCYKDDYKYADYKCPRGYDEKRGKCEKYDRKVATKACPKGYDSKQGKCALLVTK